VIHYIDEDSKKQNEAFNYLHDVIIFQVEHSKIQNEQYKIKKNFSKYKMNSQKN